MRSASVVLNDAKWETTTGHVIGPTCLYDDIMTSWSYHVTSRKFLIRIIMAAIWSWWIEFLFTTVNPFWAVLGIYQSGNEHLLILLSTSF